jgi:hypothetical protein
MKIAKIGIVALSIWLVTGSYACKTKEHCNCPTFGNHATGKTGVYRTNGRNH